MTEDEASQRLRESVFALRALVEQRISVYNELKGEYERFESEIREALGGIEQSSQEAMEKLQQIAQRTTELERNYKRILILRGQLGQFSVAADQLLKKVDGGDVALPQLGNFGDLGREVPEIERILNALLSPRQCSEKIRGTIERLQGWKPALDLGGSRALELSEGLKNVLDGRQKALRALYETVEKFPDEVLDQVEEHIQSGEDKLTELRDEVENELEGVFGSVGEVVDKIDEVRSKLDATFGALSDLREVILEGTSDTSASLEATSAALETANVVMEQIG